MMKTICNTVGVLLVLLAIVGFVNHGAMGMNLNVLHDVILLVMGGVALYFGISGTEFQARYTMRTLGIILALFGIVGFFFGPGTVTLHDLSGRIATHLMKVIPGHLELGTADSVANTILGVIALIAGFIPRETEIRVDMAAAEGKQKVTSGR